MCICEKGPVPGFQTFPLPTRLLFFVFLFLRRRPAILFQIMQIFSMICLLLAPILAIVAAPIGIRPAPEYSAVGAPSLSKGAAKATSSIIAVSDIAVGAAGIQRIDISPPSIPNEGDWKFNGFQKL
ncbi:hypothetical protein B0H13DRAFT_2131720 [Mycena leptocephala]|nr:hypothetical protein B0H13DRAFT_2131720 [Mycena leptocephala]